MRKRTKHKFPLLLKEPCQEQSKIGISGNRNLSTKDKQSVRTASKICPPWKHRMDDGQRKKTVLGRFEQEEGRSNKTSCHYWRKKFECPAELKNCAINVQKARGSNVITKFRWSGVASTSNKSKEETSATRRKTQAQSSRKASKSSVNLFHYAKFWIRFRRHTAHFQNLSSSIEEIEFMPEHFIPVQGHGCLEKSVSDRGLGVLVKTILELYLFLARLKNKNNNSTLFFIPYIL